MTDYSHHPSRHDSEYLATLVEIGLETEAEEDRLLALDAANHFDSSDGTSYGRQVIEIFMDQQGLSFKGDDQPPRKDRAPRHDIHSSETLRIGRIMNAVHRAIGSDIGVEMVLHEYVGEDSEGVPIVVDTIDPDMIPYQLTTTRINDDFRFLLSVSQDRPFAVRQKCWNDNSLPNFSIAMDAVIHTYVTEMSAAGRTS